MMRTMATIGGEDTQAGKFDIASRAAALSFGSNAVLMVLKLVIGITFGSVAVLGDGIDSAEDLFASGLAFFTVRLAMQPADEMHPYGHGKAESLAAMSQAAPIGGGAVLIAITASLRVFRDNAATIYILPSLITVGIAAVVNLAVAGYSRHAARVSGSIAIAADARHLLTNVVQALAIGAGLILVAITGKQIFDPIMALLLAAYLLWIAVGIFRTATSELIDTALPEDTLTLVEQCLAHESHGMRGFHALRTRKSGRETYIDLHVLIDPGATVRQAHVMVEHLETDLRTTVPGAIITVHVDPDEAGTRARAASDGGDIATPDGSLRLHSHDYRSE